MVNSTVVYKNCHCSSLLLPNAEVGAWVLLCSEEQTLKEISSVLQLTQHGCERIRKHVAVLSTVSQVSQAREDCH